MGYLFDASSRSIRPIVGIPGSSSLGAPLALPISIDKIAILSDQQHAIVGSPVDTDALVLDLKELRTLPINGASSSSITEIRTSPGGSVAGLFYAAAKRIVIVGGLPDTPVVRATIDISFVKDPLRRFAIADDATALLDFSSDEQDTLYSWSVSAGPRYVSRASRISDMTFLGDDAVYLDAGNQQALLIRNVREQVAPAVIADSGDGLSDPVAVFVSARSEIYIGDSEGGILVLDSTGHLLRRTRCNCAITTMTPLAKAALRLTDRIDHPIYVLDGSDADRIVFIPALPSEEVQGGGQ